MLCAYEFIPKRKSSRNANLKEGELFYHVCTSANPEQDLSDRQVTQNQFVKHSKEEPIIIIFITQLADSMNFGYCESDQQNFAVMELNATEKEIKLQHQALLSYCLQRCANSCCHDFEQLCNS